MDDESVANICAIQVSTVGVTGTRTNVSGKVQSLLQDIKKVCNHPYLMLVSEAMLLPSLCTVRRTQC